MKIATWNVNSLKVRLAAIARNWRKHCKSLASMQARDMRAKERPSDHAPVIVEIEI